MKCQVCAKKTASVHLTEIINDQMTELHLCEQCAKEKGIAGLGQPFGLQDLLAGLVDFGTPISEEKKVALQCPNCKMTYEDFRKIGRLGCSQCYDTFKESLEPLLKKVHGSVQHLGKGPASDGEGLETRKALQDLYLKLQKAIQSEAFEEAAKIRDKIKKMEQGSL
ncbi:MAG: UvrB/UvrC motif-containing protein [Candidatus Omnitrophica bacterium]|jgi:Uncharacterized protein with conserved CXXC pairs|nr:UvrB/UvrC motif-containing protein [Candidatus Omnitrophota bacterium]